MVIPEGNESIMREAMAAGRHDSRSSAERSQPNFKHIVSRHSLKTSHYLWMSCTKAISPKPHQIVKLTWNQLLKYMNKWGIFYPNHHVLFFSVCASERKERSLITYWVLYLQDGSQNLTQKSVDRHTGLYTLACTHKMHKLNTKSGIRWQM